MRRVVTLGCIALGCNSVFGVDALQYETPTDAVDVGYGEGSSSSDGGSSTTSSSSTAAEGGAGGAAGSCPDGFVCRPEVEAKRLRLANGACQRAETAVPLSTCGSCECQPDADPCTTTFEVFEAGACLAGSGLTLDNMACHGFVGHPASVKATATLGATACGVAQLKTLPVAACTQALGPPCQDGVCVPEQLDCIMLDGAQECPADFPTGNSDFLQGDCTCQCTVATGDCNSGTVQFYVDSMCGQPQEGVPVDGACHNLGPELDSLSIDDGGPAITCDASLIMSEQRTVCCSAQ